MSTKLQNDNKEKRVTKQVRLSAENHRRIKLLATEQGITVSKQLDKIVDKYFQEITTNVSK